MNLIPFFKTSITALLLCLFCFSSSAQTYSSSASSTFSFSAGMTNSDLRNDTINYKRGTLCGAGFMYTVVLSESFNVGLELLYNGKSVKNDSPIIKYRYFYLDIPLYAQYKLGENIRFNLGGQYSSFTNSKIIFLQGNNSAGVDIQPFKNVLPSDVSVLFGVEIDLTENLALAARYVMPVSAFSKNDKIGFEVFQLSFNYAVYRSHKQFLNRHKEEK